jgi:putative PIN family toxin of toxin-antitoxin system
LRAVLDVNVLISAALSSRGPSARIMPAWRNGAFDLIVSPLLLADLQRAFNYPKVRKRVAAAKSHQFVSWLNREAMLVNDPDTRPPTPSPDPGDDYLLALAACEQAMLVSHDQHLLSLRDQYPIRTPNEFLELITTDA